MKQFASYVSELRALACDSMGAESAGTRRQDEIVAALDGQPSTRLRQLVALELLRQDGVFFSGSELAAQAIAPIADQLNRQSRVYDPACGAGDLLLACATHLPLESTLGETLQTWSQCLMGRDLHHEFAEAARYRLALLAMNRGATTSSSLDLEKYFPKIRVARGELDRRALRSTTHLVVNPPFTQVAAPASCTWRRGRVSMAALFVEECLRGLQANARLVAILPDVLRSGHGYARWREIVEKSCRIERIDVFGRFSESANVDVFILEAVRKTRATDGKAAWIGKCLSENSVGDFFTVSVGSVVDYRDEHRGPWRRFATSRNLPRWSTVQEVVGSRRTTKQPVSPPFVAVRRTSSPKDSRRAVATLVSGKNLVAVENHLLVLKPKDGKVASCRELVKVLKHESTSTWLNNRIRCRHLTVRAVGEIPWIDTSGEK